MVSQVWHLWIIRKLLSSSLDGNIAVSAAIYYKLEQWDQIYHHLVSIFTKPKNEKSIVLEVHVFCYILHQTPKIGFISIPSTFEFNYAR